MHKGSVLQACVGVCLRVAKGARARVQIAALHCGELHDEKKKTEKKREAIMCYAGLVLKQGISGKL